MFKFNIPLTIILSSGSLILLVLGSLLLVSNTASSSNINVPELEGIAVTEALIASPTQSSESANSVDIEDSQSQNSALRDGRRRSGRLYGGQSGYGSQQQVSLDNYASAYAGAPSNSDQSSNLVQSTVQANDASSFASFGELPSSSSAMTSGSSARQLASSDSYSPHSSYYSGYITPSSSSTSYNGQSSNAGSSYHSPMHHSYSPQHYHKVAASSPSLGYSSGNNYDRHSLGSSYYDRNYLPSALATPLWASSSPSASAGLMSSASSALSHWTGGWGLGEIVCTLIAISIGAIILGAPFFLIYLALMGNFSGSGTLSLTNPTGAATAGGATTTVSNGRRKRLAIFEQLNSLSEMSKQSSEFGKFVDSILHQLNPLVDTRQVTETFKHLTESIEKYSNPKTVMKTKKSK